MGSRIYPPRDNLPMPELARSPGHGGSPVVDNHLGCRGADGADADCIILRQSCPNRQLP
jgi:hypothetical protein